jgi:hypothetical protein
LLIDRAERLLQRTGSLVRRATRPVMRLPVELRVGILFGVIIIGVFFAAVVPLLTSGGGTPTAEINGTLPQQLTLGGQSTVSVAVDNTGDAIISTLCIRITADPAGTVTPVSASFQGLETATFSGDRVCGGSLSGGEVISVRILLQGARTGSAKVSMVVENGTTDISPQRSAIVAVVAPGS